MVNRPIKVTVLPRIVKCYQEIWKNLLNKQNTHNIFNFNVKQLNALASCMVLNTGKYGKFSLGGAVKYFKWKVTN